MTIDLRDTALPARAVCEALGLSPHPEGGHYRELWRDSPASGRGAGTSILFLLAAGERSHWHRVDAAEVWLWQAGSPLEQAVHAAQRQTVRLGPAMLSGELLQAVVPVMAWQAARSLCWIIDSESWRDPALARRAAVT